jgi:tRNA (Thr-GGU) A37 N-methylase
VKTMLPVAAPAVVGANCTLKESDWPPVSVFGRESPVMPNPVPVTVARLMTRFVVPVLVS